MMVMGSVFSTFGDGIKFIFERQESEAGTVQVGGLSEMWTLGSHHYAVSGLAVLIATALAMPLGLWLGHLGRAQFFAVGVANIGRAVPALVIIGLALAYLGTGFTNVCFALTLLAIPPILTTAYVGVRQVDRDLVDAARGQGMTEAQILRDVELPLALPTVFNGIRLSMISVLATAIIAPEAGYDTLGTPIISFNVYGESGQVGAAMLVAFLTLVTDGIFVGVQKAVTPKGLKVARGDSKRRRALSLPRRSVQVP